MNSNSASYAIAQKSGSNFFPSFRFLPLEQREALSAVYAFCRLVDDEVDQATDEKRARQQLHQWKGRLLACYRGPLNEEFPFLRELRQAIERFEISEKYFLDLLTGVEMDLSKKRYETFRDLEIYCYHVAGTVGLMCNQIFGGRSEAHGHYARLLGTALQLTNIIRDVGQDLQSGRIYLPLEDLSLFGYSQKELEGRIQNERFIRLMEFQSARTHGFFQEARNALSCRERKGVVPAEMMRSFYEALLKKIERKRFPVLRKKVSLSPSEKGFLLARVWLGSLL
ncbi:MAG: phytoene/squalene synthase family protein [Deltaproteobacteria bacterium]|nr:phytoene/squalene synthase family protein [Deltaproteobacteria bacterium]